MDAAPERNDGLVGLVTSNLETGSIILAGPKGDVTVVWNGEGQRERALPPGTYRVRTTRVEKERDRDHWFISSTSPPKKPTVVEAGKTARIVVDDTIHFVGRVKPHHGKLHVGFVIKGADGRGLSVYKNKKRVPVTYRLLSRKGKALSSGKLNYG